MAWSDNMIPLFRAYSGDAVVPYTYDDARVEQLLVSAAPMVLMELDFDNDYIVDIVGVSISPDPTQTGEQDFETLVALKAACIVAMSEYRTAAQQGMAVRDGPSSIDTRGRVAGLKEVAKDRCEMYNRARMAYALDGGLSGVAIVGPHLTAESEGAGGAGQGR